MTLMRVLGDGTIGWIKAHVSSSLTTATGDVDLAGNVVVGGSRRPDDAVDLGDGPVTWIDGRSAPTRW